MADPVRVVIDCDTGVDDAMAILYGLLVTILVIGMIVTHVPQNRL